MRLLKPVCLCLLGSWMFVSTTIADESVRYLVEIDNTWSTTTHPDAFHDSLSHFSWVGGGTHSDQLELWRVNELASPGMVQMAESGETTILLDEVQAAMEQGLAYTKIDQPHWFCPEETDVQQCGPNQFEIELSSDFDRVSLVTMLGPSPDWFVGVNGLPLRDEKGWINQRVHTLYPYDGGTRAANALAMRGPLTEPPDPITHITPESGQIISDRPIGSLILTRIVECDLDGDFVCTSADIDLLVEPFENLDFDLDGNGTTDEGDRTFWIEDMMGTTVGDVDLDQDVDFSDFTQLAMNYNRNEGWAGGDFDGSGRTDFKDFLGLAANFGNQPSAEAAAVPEPSARLAMLVGVTMLLLVRRRQR